MSLGGCGHVPRPRYCRGCIDSMGYEACVRCDGVGICDRWDVAPYARGMCHACHGSGIEHDPVFDAPAIHDRHG